MKKTELEYAEQLIEQYRIRMGSRGYQNFKSVCVQCNDDETDRIA